MFRGNKTVSLDSKGRISIPSHYRTRLLEASGGTVIVAPSFRSSSLDLFPLYEWEEKVENYIDTLDSKKQILLRRAVIGRAQECEMDGSGRILLSQKLRDYAGLEKSAVLAGVGYKLELWNEVDWIEASLEEEGLSKEDLSLLEDVYI
ncbi:MAG: division/cell wall cluster transcriptional repressor MraZ [Gammaproteobacteria bacterium]|uniref:Transcriptional regulator MraZ n=1 Tax=Candidatus Thiopontia autotrophica TaxID=2841688 RepID=A0A8J6TNI9_9GAMM|nr:division/cell wall cluster transcriptional repressor MraZ [Candidatus Thiopontia autotrophica]MBL6969696.1 division/cell wall cluster transcriptional repressor MraZ [Gammaproteobacteria bacterium]